MTKKSIFLIAFIICSTLGCIKKNTELSSPEENNSTLNIKVNEVQTVMAAPDSSIESRLINNYGLVYLNSSQVGNLQFPSFSNYEEASAYIESFLSQTQNWQSPIPQQIKNYNYSVESSLSDKKEKKIKKKEDNSSYLLLPDCTSSGSRYGSISGSGGILSSFNFYLSNNSSGITDINFYVTGVPLLWGWNQTQSFLNGFNGCTAGTITWGVTIGNTPIGLVSEYHWKYTLDASNCILYLRWGSGPC